MPAPRLIPIAPTQGDPVSIDRSPFWIGSSSGSGLRVYLPGVADRHASISEREDGFYLSPFSGGTGVRLNGRQLTGPTRLADGAVIELAPSARYEYVTGESRAKPAEEESEPVYAEAGGPRRAWWKRRRGPRGKAGFPLWMWAALALLGVALGYGGVVLYRIVASGPPEQAGPPPLTEIEGRMFDSLMVEATQHIERGSTLLDLGLPDDAAREFAGAITLFDASPIARNEWVSQRVAVLAKTVADIYRSNRLAVPGSIRAGRSRLTDLSRSLSSNLSADQFGTAVGSVQNAFQVQFRRAFAITGRDHPEHLSLYGAGGAMDVRVKDLTADQIRFLIDGFARTGIRVKDFSQDAILQAQIKAALARGWTDRAGTGLHLHIDRFRDRRDKWTVTFYPSAPNAPAHSPIEAIRVVGSGSTARITARTTAGG